jgi:hypothetical protein
MIDPLAGFGFNIIWSLATLEVVDGGVAAYGAFYLSSLLYIKIIQESISKRGN